MKHNGHILTLLAMLLLLGAIPSAHGQAPPPQSGAAEPQPGGVVDDPIRRLNLTPEQREQIRSIREQTKAERAALNQQFREANRALDTLLDTDTPNEAEVEQRVREVAAAQSAALRARILTEIRIRRVLTLEQRSLLRTLQRQARELRRERLEDNSEVRQQRQADRANGLQNPRPIPRRRF
jgi:Spy/CpxP family protein refolding chaperone